ncbi:MAG: hypothetical protein ACXWV7_04570, partial [Nitrospira sp.]
AIGIGVAWLTRWALCATEDGFTQIGITLLVPYIGWVIAESVHASAVLACVGWVVSPSVFQRRRGADNQITGPRGVGSFDLYPERSDIHSDRFSAGRVA